MKASVASNLGFETHGPRASADAAFFCSLFSHSQAVVMESVTSPRMKCSLPGNRRGQYRFRFFPASLIPAHNAVVQIAVASPVKREVVGSNPIAGFGRRSSGWLERVRCGIRFFPAFLFQAQKSCGEDSGYIEHTGSNPVAARLHSLMARQRSERNRRAIAARHHAAIAFSQL